MEEIDFRELQDDEIECQRPGCWLIHLRAAADVACDAL